MTTENEKKSGSKPLSLSDLIAREIERENTREKTIIPDLENQEKELDRLLTNTTDTTEKNILTILHNFVTLRQWLYANDSLNLLGLRIVAWEIEQLKKKSKRSKVARITEDEMNARINAAVAKKFAAIWDAKGHERIYH